MSDKPLATVLDRLAEQAGARWSTLHAVYDSAHALNSLDAALCDDGKLEPAGWTQIAPDLPKDTDIMPGPDAPIPGPGPDGADWCGSCATATL